jgi:hypothetical protein
LILVTVVFVSRQKSFLSGLIIVRRGGLTQRESFANTTGQVVLAEKGADNKLRDRQPPEAVANRKREGVMGKNLF